MDHNSPLDSLPTMSEINMTPLMDLTFILLITFIITFPLIEQGIPIDLPTGEASELAEEVSRTVTLDAKGKLYLDNRQVSTDELAEELSALSKANSNITIYLKSDRRVLYGEVIKVLRILHDADISSMALVTQPGEGE